MLYVPSEGRGFVAPIDGYLSLRRILVPATEASTLPAALATAISLAEAIGDPAVTIQILGGDGDEKPQISTQRESKSWKIEAAPLMGNPIDAVLRAARGVDLVVVPAAGHDVVSRSLHESNTDRVVRAAPSTVLVVPTA